MCVCEGKDGGGCVCVCVCAGILSLYRLPVSRFFGLKSAALVFAWLFPSCGGLLFFHSCLLRVASICTGVYGLLCMCVCAAFVFVPLWIAKIVLRDDSGVGDRF